MKIDSENEFNNQNNSDSQNKNDFEVDISRILLNAKRASSHLEKGFDLDEHLRELNVSVDELASTKDLGNKNIKPVQKKKSMKWLYIVLILVFLFSGAVFGYYKLFMGGGGKNIVKTEWGDVAFDVPQAEDMVNILAIGFDQGGYRTDTMMIINYNPKTSNVNLISIPRDTMVEIKGKRMKLNAVFAIGKFEMTVDTIKKITGLPIHYYIAVDTGGFRKIIDTLGGVDFDVPQNMKYTDPTQGLYIDLKKGMQHLDGNKAEQLVRFRKYPMADLQRENVQKKFVQALIEQKLNLANISNLPKMKELFDELNQYVKSNITFGDVTKYFISALKINSNSFKAYTLPGEPRMVNGISYYLYSKKQTADLYKQIMGVDVGSKIDLSQGVDINDIEKMANQSTNNDQVDITHKTNDKNTLSVPSNENIKINDGKDIEINDVGAVKQVKPDNNMDSSSQSDSSKDSQMENTNNIGGNSATNQNSGSAISNTSGSGSAGSDSMNKNTTGSGSVSPNIISPGAAGSNTTNSGQVNSNNNN